MPPEGGGLCWPPAKEVLNVGGRRKVLVRGGLRKKHAQAQGGTESRRPQGKIPNFRGEGPPTSPFSITSRVPFPVPAPRPSTSTLHT